MNDVDAVGPVRAGLCHLISGFDALKDNSTADSDDLLDSMVSTHTCRHYTMAINGMLLSPLCILQEKQHAASHADVSLPVLDADGQGFEQVEYKMDAVHESGTMARVFPEAAYGCPYPPSNDTQEGCVPLRANNAGCRHGLCSRSRQSSFGRRSLPSLPLHPIT